jgi:hypothetical protein
MTIISVNTKKKKKKKKKVINALKLIILHPQ